MKTEKLWSGLIGAVLGCAAAWAGAGCLISAFGFYPDMTAVVTAVTLCAAVSAVCFSIPYGALVLASIAAMLGGYLVREGSFLLECEALIFRISGFYSSGYGVPTVSWSGADLTDQDVTGGIMLAACVIAVVICRAVCRRKRIFPAIALALIPLFACCVVTDTVPSEGYLFGLLGALVLLLLTQFVRRTNGAAGVQLTAMLLIPVMLASAVLYRAVPRDGYEMQAYALQQRLLSWFIDLPFVVQQPGGDLGISLDGAPAENLNLAAVGPKARLTYGVMDVVSDRTETLYLRGQAFDVYNGLGWTVAEDVGSEKAYWPEDGTGSDGAVSIETRITHSVKYFPYYVAGSDWLEGMDGGALKNTEAEREYSFERAAQIAKLPGEFSGAVRNQCLSLPESTLAAAEEILKSLKAETDDYAADKVSAIGKYVENLVPYSLNSARMPSEETDFAIWFLEDAESGYCTHYATAATVLLRAAGIPARFVTGYVAQTTAGVKETVTADKSHAWVEYLDPDTNCWAVLDPTPEEWLEEPTEPSRETTEATEAPTRPAETEPSETQPSQTEPSETTAPTQATQPSDGNGGGGNGQGTSQKADYAWLWKVLAAILAVLGVLLCAALQYSLRQRLWIRWLHTGTANQQALKRWRFVRKMGKILKTTPPERLETLAEKAAFSQHTLTEEELAEFDAWLEEARQTLQKKPRMHRILIRLIWAIE